MVTFAAEGSAVAPPSSFCLEGDNGSPDKPEDDASIYFNVLVRFSPQPA